MPLLALPNELIAHILRFTQIDSKREFVKLRFVCREFDDHVSRVTLKNSSLSELDIGRKLHWRLSIEWMLATKARIQTCEQGVFAFVYDAAKHVVGRGLIPELTLDAAVVAACRLIVAVNEPSWVVKHLVTWKSGHPLPQSLSSLEIYSRGQKVQNPDTFYGMLHLLVACGDKVAVESVMKKLANINAVDSVATHPVFGGLMHAAIVLDQTAAIRTFLLHGLDPRTVIVEGKKTGTLVYAAEMNREAAVRILSVSTSINISARGRFGNTALGWAVRRGWTEVVRLLLQRDDINPHLGNRLEESPLNSAAEKDREDIARLLLDSMTDVPPLLGSSSSSCPWRVALVSGTTRVVRLILGRFGNAIDVNKPLCWGWDGTPLHVAASQGSTPLVRVLLDVPGIKPDMTHHGSTPLELAVQRGDTEIVRLLLRCRANVERRIRGKLLAQIALEHYRTEIFELLVERATEIGPDNWRQWPELYDVTQRDTRFEMTVLRTFLNIPRFRSENKDVLQQILWRSANDGNVPVVEELLRYEEVDPNYGSGTKSLDMKFTLRDGYNYQDYRLSKKSAFKDYLCPGDLADTRTPLLVAAETGQEAVFSIIYGHPRTERHAKDALGRTCLWWAAECPSMKIVREILDRSTDIASIINVQDDDGWAPLHVASDENNRSIVKLLLKHPEIDVNVATEDGWTPLHIATNENNGPIVKLLLKRPEIDVNVAIKEGWTPLHMAMVSCNRKMTNALLGHLGIDTSLRIDDGRTAFDLHEGCECAISSDISQRIGT